MICADFEILLCDYVDGTLSGTAREEFEAHRAVCPACAAYAADVAGAVQFLRTVETPEPPPELLAKIAFGIPSGGVRRGWRASLFGWLQPALQPRFAMGMAMTILSFSMLGQYVGIDARQLKASDLHPAAVWSAADNRLHRTWERAVKYYENLRVVYEVQARLQEWTQQDEEEQLKGRPEENQRNGSGRKTEGSGAK